MNLKYTKWAWPLALFGTSLMLAACQQGAPDSDSTATPSHSQVETVTTATPDPVDTAQIEDAIQAGLAAAAADAVSESAPPAPAPPEPPVAPVPPPAPTPPAAPVAPSSPAPKPPAEQYGQVVSVTPVRQSINNPQEVCRDVEVAYRPASKDEGKVAGTVIGAVAGAVVGSQVGKGHGRDAARIAGAIGGAVAGRKIQENQQAKRTETRIEQECETVNDETWEVVAYDIIYSYDGVSHEARVAEDPGERIKLPVRSIDP